MSLQIDIYLSFYHQIQNMVLTIQIENPQYPRRDSHTVDRMVGRRTYPLFLEQFLVLYQFRTSSYAVSDEGSQRLIVPFGDPNPRLEAKRRVDEVGGGDDVR